MNKLASASMYKIKQDMKNRYLAGESIPSIAKFYKVVARNVYYHIGELSAEEKGIHAQNLSLHQDLTKKEAHEKQKTITYGKAGGTGHETIGLDDFK